MALFSLCSSPVKVSSIQQTGRTKEEKKSQMGEEENAVNGTHSLPPPSTLPGLKNQQKNGSFERAPWFLDLVSLLKAAARWPTNCLSPSPTRGPRRPPFLSWISPQTGSLNPFIAPVIGYSIRCLSVMDACGRVDIFAIIGIQQNNMLSGSFWFPVQTALGLTCSPTLLFAISILPACCYITLVFWLEGFSGSSTSQPIFFFFALCA